MPCNSQPYHAASLSSLRSDRSDLTPAPVWWILALTRLKEIFYETTTASHILRLAAVIGLRLQRMLQTCRSRRRVAETHQDAGHTPVPESQPALQGRAAVHRRHDRRSASPSPFAQRRFDPG